MQGASEKCSNCLKLPNPTWEDRILWQAMHALLVLSDMQGPLPCSIFPEQFDYFHFWVNLISWFMEGCCIIWSYYIVDTKVVFHGELCVYKGSWKWAEVESSVVSKSWVKKSVSCQCDFRIKTSVLRQVRGLAKLDSKVWSWIWFRVAAPGWSVGIPFFS